MKKNCTPDEQKKWIDAAHKEMAKQLKNGTWRIADIPSKKTLLPLRWVFRIKDDGTYKACLVAKGFRQREGIDYERVCPLQMFARPSSGHVS